MRCTFLCFLGFLLLWGVTACQSPEKLPVVSSTGQITVTARATSLRATAPAFTPTSAHLLTPSPTASPVPSATAVPPTDTPPATFTAVPTSTPSPLTPTPDRTCPDPPPAKPDYAHNVLAAQPWPTPDTAVAPTHFRLTDPVSGDRKPLENGYYPYGWDGGGRFLLHNGADMPKEQGTLVTAVAAATVVVAQSDVDALYGWRCDWYGQLVVLELDDQWLGQPVYVLYGHVQEVQVQPGQHVQQGDPLAQVGVEGVSTVPHLHLEIRVGGNGFADTQNPMLWLAPLPETGVIAGRLVDITGRPWQGVRVTLIEAAADGPVYHYTFTYLDDPQHIIHPHVALAENFVFADLPSGNYTLFVAVGGAEYRQPVVVHGGEVTAVKIFAEPEE